MTKKAVIIRYSEIHLKGKNKHFFVNQLKGNIASALEGLEIGKIQYKAKRYIIEHKDDKKLIQQISKRLKKVFGIYSFSFSDVIKTSKDNIYNYINEYKLANSTKTFAVNVNRADKKFKEKSPDLERKLGSIIFENNNTDSNLSVKLNRPDEEIFLDIRENGYTYIFNHIIKGQGGMPVGSSGTGIALLSGGIDSPVAIHKVANRGMKLDMIHFHTYPYTSQEAKDKVIKLANDLKKYTLSKKLYMVSITQIQEQINMQVESDYIITIMRRVMIKIAEKIALNNKYQAIITGENLAQVSSQTIEGITSTQDALNAPIPILRPLISDTKEDIIIKAKKIGTYITSIQPHEDCCTMFLPKNPIIKPRLKFVRQQESKVDNLDEKIDQIIEKMQVIQL